MSLDRTNVSPPPKLGSFHVYESWLRLLGRLPRLLMAEDDDDTRSALVELFERSGYDVRSVADGSSLLYRLEPMLLSEPGHWPPDLIITDIRMPGIDALSIVEELREVGWETPVIIITGYGNRQTRQRIDQMDGADYFEKPIDVGGLEETVREMIFESEGV
jgi:CheY-like chemotaxis protein